MKELSKDLEIAERMREKSYSPYSNYTVGCVLVCKNGKKYTGCNIENAGIQSICSERVAFSKAISEGERDFDYILTVGGKKGEKSEECLPCGYCRQFINEFVNNDFKIYSVNDNYINEYSINDLLPRSFKL